MVELQPVFKDNLKYIIDIIGILENLELRLPHLQFNKYVIESEDHVNEHFEKQQDIYETKNDHFERCPQMENLRNRSSSNLRHVENIITELQKNILILKKEWKREIQ